MTVLVWISHIHIRLFPVTIPNNSHDTEFNSQKPICRQEQPQLCTSLSRITEWSWKIISGSSKPQLGLDFPSQLCRDTALLFVVHLPPQPFWAPLFHPKWAWNLSVWGKQPFPRGDLTVSEVLGVLTACWTLFWEVGAVPGC